MAPPARARSLYLLTLALVCCVVPMARAERPPLKAYTTADGLPHDSINKIYRDSRGFLWFCTADGLSRFDGYRFKNYTQEQGLPHRNVNDIVETKAGVYLVATSEGLSVFNPLGKPYRWNVRESRLDQTSSETPLFRTFLPPVTHGRQSRTVISVIEDGSGRIWAGTHLGLFRVRPVENAWTFTEFDLTTPTGSVPGVGSLVPDGSGGVLVASTNGVLRIAPDDRVTRLLIDPVGALFRDRRGRLWADAGLQLKVLTLDGDTATVVQTYTQRDGLPPNAVHFSTIETTDGRIYVGFEYGFGELRPDAKPGESKIRLFEREKINALAEDAAGALWVGTDTRGAWKLAATGFTTFGEADGLSPSDEIMSVFPDSTGGVYLTSRPNKLSHLGAGRLESVLPFGLTSRSWGWHLLDRPSHHGEWWIPGADGLRHYTRVAQFADLARRPPAHVYTTADGLVTSEVFSQFEDSRGDLWFSIIGGIVDTVHRWDRQTERVFVYGVHDGLPAGNGPIAFAEDRQGNLWLGFYFGGLARYRNGRFRLFGEKEGLPYTQIADLLLDNGGRLWIATSARGLFRIDDTSVETPSFRSVSTADGVSSNQTICLAQDRDGRVYAGTGRGINRIDPAGRLKVFTQDDGLPSNQVTRCAAGADGALWFVARNTLIRFQPDVEQPSRPPSVLIDRVLVNGLPQRISELGETDPAPLDLQADQHQIQVEYLALASGATENVRYQYRLGDEEWSAPTRQQTVNFDLSPGTRTLAIRALDSSGLASPRQAVLTLRIRPPLWLNWWFLGSAACIAVGLLFALHGYRMARLQEVNAALANARRAEEALGRAREERLAELERVRARIATDLHDDLGSSLTQIAVLSEVARQQQTDAAQRPALQPIERIISISNEVVDSMSDIVWAINPKKDHLSDLVQRMRRFASDVLSARDIAFKFQSPEAGQEIALGANVRREVFLIFKETINNVVRHAECTHVDIALGVEGDALVMIVRDNGRGFTPPGEGEASPATRGGNGLPSLRKRARDIAGTIDIMSAPGQGTTTRLHVPTHTGGA
jgi:signal transduction histidine kinase/ligand-binding sensor domain-containing protein